MIRSPDPWVFHPRALWTAGRGRARRPSVGFIRAGLGSVWEMEDSGVLLQVDPHICHVTGSIA